MIVVLIKAFAYVTVLLLCGYAAFFLALTNKARQELGSTLLPAFLTLTLFSFFSPSLWFLHLVALGLIPLLARTRRDVALLLIVTSLATPTFYTVIVVDGLKLVRWSVQNSLALGAILAFAIARGPIFRRKASADIPLFLLMALMVIVSARESSVTNFARAACSTLLSLGMPYWVVTRGIDPATDSRRLLLWLSAAATMIGVVVFYEAMTAWPLYQSAGSLFDQRGSGMFVLRMGFMRAAGPLSNSTVLGYVMACAFIAAILSRRCFRSALHHGAVVAIIGVGIVASQSRGAMLGAAVAVVLLVLFNPRGRTGAMATFAVAVAGLFALLMVGLTYYEGTAAETLSYRRQLVARGLEEFWKHPLAGDTIAAVSKRMSDLTTGEQIVDFVNTYLYFALFTGIFGAIAFLAVLLIPSVGLWRRRRRMPKDRDHLGLARFCFAVLLSSALMLGFTSLSERMTALLMAAAGLAGSIVAPRRQPGLATGTAGPRALPGIGPDGAGDLLLPQLRERDLPGI